MRSRAPIAALVLVVGACDRGSAERTQKPPPLVRVAVPAELTRDAFGRGIGASTHLKEILLDPVRDALEVVDRRGHEVIMRPRHGDESLTRLAERFRYHELVSVRVHGDQLVAELSSTEAVSRFDLEFAGLDGGSHQLAASELVLEPRPGQSAVSLELVPAPLERHWRMLNGGHVDIVPHLRKHEAAKLERLSTVELAELPDSSFVTLLVGRRLSNASATLVNQLDINTLAETVCGASCRARYPVERPAATGSDALPATLELAHLAGADAEAIGARIVAHQLLDHDVNVRILPVELAELNRRLVSGDYELLLALAPSSPKVLPKFLAFANISADQVANRVIPLWTHKLYAAYDTSICDVEPDSVSSWRWLAKVRPCEEGER